MRRPRVLIGAISGTRGGPRTYAVELARRLPAVAPDLEFAWLSDTAVPELAGTSGLRLRRLALPHPALRPLWDHLGVPGRVAAVRADVYHNTKHALPLRSRGARVVTIHDLAWRHARETFGAASALYLELTTRHAARTADAVVTVSESTRRDLQTAWDVPEDRIRVVPNGVSERFRSPSAAAVREARAALGLPPRFVLFAGTLQARKNPDVVLAAWAALPAAVRRDAPLVFAGRPGWKLGGFLDRLAAARDEGVRHLGAVPDRLMPGLFSAATVFVSPSRYEGFGLTVLEAMAAGAPVVAGETSSIPEVTGGAALLVPPREPAAVRDALARLLGDPDLARDLARRGRARAESFTWEAAARRTAGVYREVLAASS